MRSIRASFVQAPLPRIGQARIGAAFLCTLGLVFAVAATPASAVTVGHILTQTIGEPGSGAGQFGSGGFDGYLSVAVEDATGDVYVGDSAHARVVKFGPAGNFLRTWGYGVVDGSDEFQVCVAPGPCQTGQAGFAPGQFSSVGQIAVDNSEGPNQGRVYVVDVAREEILKFSPQGAYLGAIDGEQSPLGRFRQMRAAIAVDGNGFVWAADGYRVLRFSNQPGNAYVGGSEIGASQPVGAIAPVGDGSSVYTLNAYEHALYRYPASGGEGVVSLPYPTGGVTVVDPVTGHFYVGVSPEGSGTSWIQEYDGDPAEPKPVNPRFGVNEFPIGIMAIALRPSTNTIYAMGAANFKVNLYGPRRVPETVTAPATEVRHTTATLQGHTAPDETEGGPVSECYFEWGLTFAYDHKTPCSPGAPLADDTEVSAEISGLVQESTYHFRLAAANSVDTEHGEDRTFTPHAVLQTSTVDVTDLSPIGATLNGSFNPDGQSTQYYFEWGKGKANGSFDHTTPISDGGSGVGTVAVSAALSGLEDYTLYHYRLSATNSLGTSYGAERTFRTTPPSPPTIEGSVASIAGASGATLSATFTPHYGETIYGFEYGETSSYGLQKLGSGLLPADDEPHPVSLEVGGLLPGNTYHFRAIAVNFGGIARGPDLLVTTPGPPEIVSVAVSSIGSAGATLTALVSPRLSDTTVRFHYGKGVDYAGTTAAVDIGAGSSAQPVAVPVGGLQPETTYHFRAEAENAIGAITGSDATFTTLPAAGHSEPPAPKCKRGFVRRHGKCVRKRKRRTRANGQRNHKRPAGNGAAARRHA